MADVTFTHTFVPRDEAELSQPDSIMKAKSDAKKGRFGVRKFIETKESLNSMSGMPDNLSGIPDTGKRISR